MDFSKIFESTLEILRKFIPQFNKVIIFLFASYFLLDLPYRNSIKQWVVNTSQSAFLLNLKDILESFGIEAVLPFAALLILIAIIFYFDIISTQIGSILPPYIMTYRDVFLRRHFSRENIIEIWRVNPESRSIYDIADFLDAEFERNSTNSFFKNASIFQQINNEAHKWMSFLKFLSLWTILLPFLFPPAPLSQNVSVKVNFVLFLIFVCWIYFLIKYTDSMKWLCVWKLHSVLDLHRDNKSKKDVENEEYDLPDFLKENEWKRVERYQNREFRRERAIKLRVFSFDSFERWKDIALAFIPFFERVPFFDIPNAWKKWHHAEKLKQKKRDFLPVPNQATINYIQKQLYSKTAQQVLEVPDPIKTNYRSFLTRVKGSGIVRIAPRGRYTGLIDLEEGGSSYSFSACCHDPDYDLREVSLDVGSRVFRPEQTGCILDLGDIELPESTPITTDFINQLNEPERSKFKAIIKLETPLDENSLDQLRIERHTELSLYDATAITGHVYLLRVFSRKYDYKRNEAEITITDSITIFKAVKQLQDGSFVILWRLLHSSNVDLDKFTTIKI